MSEHSGLYTFVSLVCAVLSTWFGIIIVTLLAAFGMYKLALKLAVKFAHNIERTLDELGMEELDK